MDGDRDLRLLVYNIYHLNPDPQGIVAEVERYDPDVIFLMEYSSAIQAQIEPQLADYPHRLIRPSRWTMGLALFSRVPLADAQIYRFEGTRIPIFQVEMQVADQPVIFVGGHPWPPLGRWGPLHRAQVAEIQRVAAQAAPPLIVAGDFNASPWSHAMQNLARLAGVADARRGFGLSKTWRPLPGVGLPLDHVLVSPEWTVLTYAYGNPGGSDHVPLVLDLRLGQ
jgi:endonuclease/exonuclease/phosphatase (EEP) superfamily protein YafD